MNAFTRFHRWLDFNFWEDLSGEQPTPEFLKERKAAIRATISAIGPDQRREYLEMVRRWYAEQEATRASITSRAASLTLFSGLILTTATLVAGNVSTPLDPLRYATIALGLALAYACLAVGFGSLRSHGVQRFTVPSLTPKAVMAAGEELDIEEAAEYALAHEQNTPVIANLAAYLRFGQMWARRALVLAVILAVVAVASAATKTTPGADAPARGLQSTAPPATQSASTTEPTTASPASATSAPSP